MEVSLCHPTIAIFAGRLLLIGGVDYLTPIPRANQALLMLPLKEGRVISKPLSIGNVTKDDLVGFESVGAVHHGEGWMAFLRPGKQPSVVRLKRVGNEQVEVEVIKNS